MKKGIIIVIILVLLLVLVAGGVAFMNRKKVIQYHSLKYLSFGYSTSTMYLGAVSYHIELKDEKYIATIQLEGVEEEDAKKVTLTDSDIEKVMNIINTYQVSTWDGFQKSDPYVLDGNSFSFYMTTQEGESVSASGYMMWPKNYHEVRDEFDSFFQSLI